MVSYAHFHRRRDAQGLMNPAKVVPSEMQAIRSPEVLPLLAESIRQAGEMAHAHADREVLALYMGCADSASIGVSHNWGHLRRNHFAGRVAVFIGRIAVHLNLLRIIAAVAKRGGDCRNVGLKAISADLEALLTGSSGTQTFDKNIRGGLIATAQSEVQDQLGMALDCHVAIGVADGIVVRLSRQLMGFLLADVGPDLITSNVLNRHVHNQSAHNLLALLTRQHQELHDGVAVDSGNALRRTDAVAFQEQPKGEDGLLRVNLHPVKKLLVRLHIGLLALGAAKPRKAVTMRTKALTPHVASRASHCLSGFCCLANHAYIIERSLFICQALFLIFIWFALKGLGVVYWLRTTGRFPDTLRGYLGFRPFVLHRPTAPVPGATVGLNPWHFATSHLHLNYDR